MKSESVSGQFFVRGSLMEYTGPRVPAGKMNLPDDMGILPWLPLPKMVLLTIRGVPVAGPAWREVMESYIHGLCTDPKKAGELALLREEAQRFADSLAERNLPSL